MQRQSLGGSPSRLHIINDGASSPLDDNKKKKKHLDEDERGIAVEADDEEESKVSKLHHHNRSSFRIEKTIHLIPILTLSCFLILYLCSHDPSQNDLMSFSGFKRISTKLDSTGIDESTRFPAIKTGGILAIRSLRSLQEVEKIKKRAKKPRVHRKLGDF